MILPWCYGQWTPCLKNRECPFDTSCFHAEEEALDMIHADKDVYARLHGARCP